MTTASILYEETFHEDLVCPLTYLDKHNFLAAEFRYDTDTYEWNLPVMRIECPQCQRPTFYGSNVSMEDEECLQFKCPDCCVYYSICALCNADAINRRESKVHLMQLLTIENHQNISTKCADYKIVRRSVRKVDSDTEPVHFVIEENEITDYSNTSDLPYRQSLSEIRFELSQPYVETKIVLESANAYDEHPFGRLTGDCGGCITEWYCSSCDRKMNISDK